MDYRGIYEAVIQALSRYRSVLILIKGSPDPDALASSFCLAQICGQLGIKSAIFGRTPLSLPQNKLMIAKLGIELNIKDRIPFKDYESYAVLDFQKADSGEEVVSIPCVLHIDHHSKIEQAVTPDYQLITDAVNSVSTILGGIYLNAAPKAEEAMHRRLCTALAYGIKVDTDNLKHAQDIDREILGTLMRDCDTELLTSLDETPFSEETMTIISKAMISSFTYKNWLIAGTGFIPATARDSLAITADYLLEFEKTAAVFVFGIVQGPHLYLDTSIRTKNRKLDLNRIIRHMSPTTGGARSYKGAFQYDLSYFAPLPKADLWNMVNVATGENIKRARDALSRPEITSFVRTIAEGIKRLFR